MYFVQVVPYQVPYLRKFLACHLMVFEEVYCKEVPVRDCVRTSGRSDDGFAAVASRAPSTATTVGIAMEPPIHIVTGSPVARPRRCDDYGSGGVGTTRQRSSLLHAIQTTTMTRAAILHTGTGPACTPTTLAAMGGDSTRSATIQLQHGLRRRLRTLSGSAHLRHEGAETATPLRRLSPVRPNDEGSDDNLEHI
ncbi:hypothetical protein EDB85DRAFT_1895397 [Lactarius pseudohatsudake]|nr:hypothetical protein EDB85DRAFT_1895397 [Lactarius pseudohatsudake]